MSPEEKKKRISKLKERIANAERLYSRSMRMAGKYSRKINGMYNTLNKIQKP